MQATIRVFLSLFLLSVGFAQAPSISAPPDTPKKPTTDEYHGVKVTENYRWLENWDDPAVKQWSEAQNARARAYLDSLPSRPQIKQQLKVLLAASSGYYDVKCHGGTLFAMRSVASKQQDYLIALRSPDETENEKIVVDPNTMTGMSIDFYQPSLDGKLVAVSLSAGGSEDGAAHVYEVATGRELPDQVPRVNFATAAGSIAWNKDGTGFYYTRYPQGNERPAEDANFYQQVYFHKLGTDSSQDAYVIGKDFPRIAEVQLQTSDDGQWLLAAVANGDGGDFAHYVMNAAGKWTQVTRFEDRVVSVKLGVGSDAALYMLSRKDAPLGKVLRLPSSDLTLTKAKIIVAENPKTGPDGNATIQGIVPTEARIFIQELAGGPYRVRYFKQDGSDGRTVPTPPISSVREIVHVQGDNVLYRVSSYLVPTVYYRYDASSDKSISTAMRSLYPVSFNDAEVVRDFASSKDGTKVPVNIIRHKGTKLDGSNPTLLIGYGGYNISLSPAFIGALGRVWLDGGGVYVIANLRGGGEYGEEWHTGGNLTRKQNVFDDFIGAAEYLINTKYTSPEHLAILGGSNGGLLMGAVTTQRPDLFRAVVTEVGIYDMLRVELDPNGAFNVTEFGTVKDPQQFKALYGYSPYHHVKDAAQYPAVLLMTGENDHRVNPMESRKMTARLQAANASSHPILLRTTSGAGHGFGTALDEQIEQTADILSFLFDQLGVRYTAPPSGTK
jgi:prolyl oligopeptidase